MKFLSIAIALLLTACGERYPGWEQVRLEETVPDQCEYRMQEVCIQPGNKCLNWHKQRATTFGANTVVITKSGKDDKASFSAFSGNFHKYAEGTSLAEYYHCVGPKFVVLPRAER